jgi:N-acetylmuramoyl-L-alanine amidase-like protein
LNFRSSLTRTHLLLCLLTVGSLSACTSVPPASIDAPPEYDTVTAYPHWAGKPVSWTKLGDIEAWLIGNGPEQYPEYVDRAELELAEGRLSLARKESSGVASPVLAGRLRAAETGFKGVLRKSGLDPALKIRAERGLDEIETLRGTPVASSAKPSPAARPGSSALPANLPIQSRSAWHAATPVMGRLTAAGGPWSRITIHHSAKYSKEIGLPSSGNVASTIKDIQTVHMRDEGYGDIGYHFLIDPAGRIWQGRTLDWQGAHAGGANGTNNIGNIGICLLGDFNTEKPDPRALTALEQLVDKLCERHKIARSRIYGHRQLRSTECPGDALMAWVSRYAAGATH